MQYIKWSSALHSTGIKDLDDQHKRLFGLINRLFAALSLGESKDLLGEILNDLHTYAKQHFNDEENFFCKLKAYKGISKHQCEHREFLEKIITFQEEHKNNKKMLTWEVFMFLKEWIDRHIKVSDREYGWVSRKKEPGNTSLRAQKIESTK